MAMKVIESVEAIREQVAQWRRAGERISFVPTMGNLHQGHLELVKQAKQASDRVVVSIFVNPTQFDKAEDLAAYPRTLDDDKQQLIDEHVDALFLPSNTMMYPEPDTASYITIPGVGDVLEGLSRPGHFQGVATIVCKLFNSVTPDSAFFGTKDFQQLMVIKKLVRDFNIDIKIIGVPTIREQDGLAMSSRNGYLTTNERTLAPTLFSVLNDLVAHIKLKQQPLSLLKENAIKTLDNSGFKTDYIEIRRQHDLQEVEAVDEQLVVLASAWLGKARLIDNIAFERS